MQANVTAASQGYKVREHGEMAHMRHGQTVRADIPNVRVATAPGRPAEIYFCDMGPLRVKRVLSSGDDGRLPLNVALDGLDFPSSGSFDITDALISANGVIRISADEQTRVRPTVEMLRGLRIGSLFGVCEPGVAASAELGAPRPYRMIAIGSRTT